MAFPWVKNSTWADGPGGGTPLSAARLNNLEAGVSAAAPQGVASTPPSSPVDGMIWRLPMSAANGVYWYFQYDAGSASAYKWVYMGGAPMETQVLTAETTASASYVALATTGPTVTLPRAGDYIVEIAAYLRTNSAGSITFMSYDIGGTGAVDADDVQMDSAIASAGSHVYRLQTKTGLTAVALTSKYKTNGGTATIKDRAMKVTPIRVS